MHFICFILLFIFYAISYADDLDKYRLLGEQCSRLPSNSECLKLKSKFFQLIEKCQKIKTQKQVIICQEIKAKLCAVFPSTCSQTTTKKIISTRRKASTKPKLKPTTITTTTTTINNEEFVKVPINPEELRTRGEYCVRHGKEKKCQELLNNLKSTYSSCNKKKSSTTLPTKPEEIDCHSFETHMCVAFPKFPPCVKKTPKLN